MKGLLRTALKIGVSTIKLNPVKAIAYEIAKHAVIQVSKQLCKSQKNSLTKRDVNNIVIALKN